MSNTSDFKNGMILDHKNALWKIVEFLHVKPGKGAAFVRTKLKNARTGQVVEERFRAGEKVNPVRVEVRDFNYLYNDGELFFFIDNETYNQIQLTLDQVKDVKDFLIENTKTKIAFNGDEPIDVRVPQHMNMKILKTDPGERGNTAQSGTKPATLETGIIIHVPLFIQVGEIVRVDTKELKYLERVKS